MHITTRVVVRQLPVRVTNQTNFTNSACRAATMGQLLFCTSTACQHAIWHKTCLVINNVWCDLQRISAYDRLTNAVRVVIPDVMSTAAAMDTQLEAFVANGTDLPLLFCVPLLIKDNYDALDGETCTCHTMPASIS